jgi:hypothetical protein
VKDLHIAGSTWHKEHVPVGTSGNSVGETDCFIEVFFGHDRKRRHIRPKEALDGAVVFPVAFIELSPSTVGGSGGHCMILNVKVTRAGQIGTIGSIEHKVSIALAVPSVAFVGLSFVV